MLKDANPETGFPKDKGCDEDAEANLRILLIDDNESFVQGLSLLLDRHGFHVTTAHDGQQAQKVLHNEPIDLVITDVYMGSMDGLELILLLRREYPRLQVIAISGGARSIDFPGLKVARTFGAAAVLSKPIRLPALLDTIRSLGLPVPANHHGRRARSIC